MMLKSLDDALRDGDTIRAVIRGSGTNQDGEEHPHLMCNRCVLKSFQVKRQELCSLVPKLKQH